MKTVSTLFLLLLSMSKCLACDCVPIGSLTVDALNAYKSIALVKVIEVIEPYHRADRNGFPAYKIKVKTIEHYKGDTLTELIVDGGHPKFGTWTSCFFQLYEGEEWLVFTRDFEKNQGIIQPCDRNVPHRAISGLQYWQYQWTFKTLKFLDSVYQKPTKFVKKGKHEEFYANGQKEIEEVYKFGKLSGLKKIWYPNGKILGELVYKKGKLNGITKWYLEKGDLGKLIEYRKGREVYSKIYNLSLNDKIFKGYYLEQEIFYDWKKGLVTNNYYYLSGQIAHKDQISLKTGLRIGLDQQWDLTGKLIRTCEYDKEGKQINIKDY